MPAPTTPQAPGAVRRLRRLPARLLAEQRTRWRLLTRHQRALPDFVVLGAQKAGTTSLIRWLREHPDVVTLTPRIREPLYFAHHAERGDDWYRSHFPTRRELERHARRTGRPAVTGEKSSHYLYHPLAPARLATTLPDARLVAVLREPAARAVSHWRMNRDRGFEDLDLVPALLAERERVGDDLARIASGELVEVGGPAFVYGYAAMGRYLEQLERWWAAVDPERLLLVRAEDLFDQPADTYRRVLEHLGLPVDVGLPSFSNRSATTARPVTDEVRAIVAEGLGDDAERLAERTGITWPS